MYQCLNEATPSRKCSIKAPAKWRNSVYVLTEICHLRSKWLDPSIVSISLSTYAPKKSYVFFFTRAYKKSQNRRFILGIALKINHVEKLNLQTSIWNLDILQCNHCFFFKVHTRLYMIGYWMRKIILKSSPFLCLNEESQEREIQNKIIYTII